MTMVEQDEFLKVLYFGRGKRGKTTAMAGAAKLGKIVAIDIEGNGWLKRPLEQRGIPTDNIHRIVAQTYEEVEQAYWDIRGWIYDDEQPIFAVCIDHFSELEKVVLRREVMRRLAKKANRAGLTVDAPLTQFIKAGYDPFHNEFEDYNSWTNQARVLMRMFRDLPCHVAFGALVRTEKRKQVPGLTEVFREEIMGCMTLNVGCDVLDADGATEYVGYCNEVDGWVGGDRVGFTKNIVVNPSLDRLVAAYTDNTFWDNDPQQQEFKALMAG